MEIAEDGKGDHRHPQGETWTAQDVLKQFSDDEENASARPAAESKRAFPNLRFGREEHFGRRTCSIFWPARLFEPFRAANDIDEDRFERRLADPRIFSHAVSDATARQQLLSLCSFLKLDLRLVRVDPQPVATRQRT